MWSFEKQSLAIEDISKGPLQGKNCYIIWLIITGLFLGSALYSPATAPQLALYIAISPLLARLIALDLCYLVLPNIYIFPLLITGLCLSTSSIIPIDFLTSVLGVLLGGGVIFLLAILLEKWNKKMNMGGGDIKMIATAGAFLGIYLLPLFLWVACALSLLFYPLVRKKGGAISFGPALIISFWLLLLYPKIFEKILNLLI